MTCHRRGGQRWSSLEGPTQASRAPGCFSTAPLCTSAAFPRRLPRVAKNKSATFALMRPSRSWREPQQLLLASLPQKSPTPIENRSRHVSRAVPVALPQQLQARSSPCRTWAQMHRISAIKKSSDRSQRRDNAPLGAFPSLPENSPPLTSTPAPPLKRSNKRRTSALLNRQTNML